MFRPRRVLCLLTIVLAVSGCDAGPGQPLTPSKSAAGPPAPVKSAEVKKEAGPGAARVPGTVSRPEIDPKAQLAAVREAPKAEGSTSLDYLWQPAAKDQTIASEPLAVNVPAGFPPLAAFVPRGNPMTKAKWALGRQLYFDPRISLDSTVSCATCHDPAKGWTDQDSVATGIDGQQGTRSAPTVLNTVYAKSLFWDGRAPSLEAQSQGPPLNPIEMGKQTNKDIVERLRAISGYQEQFRAVFGTEVTTDGIAKAIATFERTALSGDSAYDKYVGGDLAALNESQKRGMVLFGLRSSPSDPFQAPGVTLKKANCTSCHVGFNFTDDKFHNLGVGYDSEKHTFADLGRWAVTPIGAKNDADRGAFKTPTLRDLVKTAPYMHDGSEKTLLEVMKYYNRGGNENEALDPEMKPLNLTDSEMADVIAFMEALTGVERKVELPQLPKGPDGTAPDPRGALTAPARKSADREVHAILMR